MRNGQSKKTCEPTKFSEGPNAETKMRARSTSVNVRRPSLKSRTILCRNSRGLCSGGCAVLSVALAEYPKKCCLAEHLPVWRAMSNEWFLSWHSHVVLIRPHVQIFSECCRTSACKVNSTSDVSNLLLLWQKSSGPSQVYSTLCECECHSLQAGAALSTLMGTDSACKDLPSIFEASLVISSQL